MPNCARTLWLRWLVSLEAAIWDVRNTAPHSAPAGSAAMQGYNRELQSNQAVCLKVSQSNSYSNTLFSFSPVFFLFTSIFSHFSLILPIIFCTYQIHAHSVSHSIKSVVGSFRKQKAEFGCRWLYTSFAVLNRWPTMWLKYVSPVHVHLYALVHVHLHETGWGSDDDSVSVS